MDREEYKYDSRFSKELNKQFKIYHNIYEDCKLILNSEKHLEVFSGEKSKEPTEDMLYNFNEYLKSYIDENNSGILRTLLIIAKPYRNDMAIKETFGTLSFKLRENSPTGQI
jgi:5-methylcytosine-specific restriction endonuclease McrBC regulatory subunit McrC